MTSDTSPSPGTHGGKLTLPIAALGVVFGDIGTSPLYTIRECFASPHGLPLDSSSVLGILSLIFWALTLIISAKYAFLILRADNRGEGGILALGTLAAGSLKLRSRGANSALLFLILFGAALLYGDGAITPAISVLSAIEGLKIAAPALEPWVVPITMVVLVALFSVQRFGTRRIGAVFGPVMLLWFAVLAILGIRQILHAPQVLSAINPMNAVRLFQNHSTLSFVVLGTVFLAVTGGEAMYADLGHFGKNPVRLAWYFVAMPALLLNYFGQGAFLLTHPKPTEHPFFEIAPGWALLPLVALATLATVIASQALISGVFSLTRQAMRLGYCPRLEVIHTSAMQIGQIYLPAVNWLLLIVALWLVGTFGSSSHLAGAYGVAVSLTMLITTLLVSIVSWRLWNWKAIWVAVVFTPFLLIDGAFLMANGIKIPQGGWVALLIAMVTYGLSTTWIKGRRLLAEGLRARTVPFSMFMTQIEQERPTRVNGAAVFMTANLQGTPFALLNNLRHNKVLHRTVVFLTFTTTERPHIPREERIVVEQLPHGFFRVKVSVGFMDDVDISETLAECSAHGITIPVGETTFFVGREIFLAARKNRMSMWRQKLFVFMSRNAQNATTYFSIPPSQVIEIGMQVDAQISTPL